MSSICSEGKRQRVGCWGGAKTKAMKCMKCRSDKPRACFGDYDYADHGRPRTRADYYCFPCRTMVDARLVPAKAKADEARARGYKSASNTPEYKRAQRRRVAEDEGRELIPLFGRYADGIAHRVKRAFIAELRRQWDEAFVEPDPEVERVARNKQAREQYWRNVEKARAKSAAYKHAHPMSRAKWNALRADRTVAASDGTVTSQALRSMFASAVDCPYCGCSLKGRRKSLDHIEPLAQGGTHSLRNLVICCWDCNQSKSDLGVAEWLTRVPAGRASQVKRLMVSQLGRSALIQESLWKSQGTS